MARKEYGESTGRIILIGEHAITFGEPAIAVSLNADKIKTLMEALESGNHSSIKSDVYGGMLYDVPDHLKSLVNRFIELNSITKPLAVAIQTNLPPSRGLGSGAVVAVAFVHASYDFLGKLLAKEELIEKANWVEQIAHGKPGGIDTQTIVSGKPAWFQKNHAETLKTLNLDGYMAVIDISVKGSTRQTVEDVHKLYEDPQYMSHIKHIGRLALRVSDVIEHHNFEALADIFNECHANLKALTVSHDKIEQLMKIGKEDDAITGKLTGASRGGGMLLLAKGLPTAKDIVKAVEKVGAAHTWTENLGG